MACILSEHTGGSCKTCNKFLLPPQVAHQVRGEPQPDAHNTLTGTVDTYCGACCPVHQGKRPMADRELVMWLRHHVEGPTEGPAGRIQWMTLSGLSGRIFPLDDTVSGQLYSMLAASYAARSGCGIQFQEPGMELILLLRETQ